MLNGSGVTQYDIAYDEEYNLDVIISTQGYYDQTTQIFTQERFFKYYTANDSVFEKRAKMQNRIVQLSEFRLLLEKCGYQIDAEYGGYNFTEFNATSPCLVVVASPVG